LLQFDPYSTVWIVATEVEKVVVPAGAAELSTLPRVDYMDAFRVDLALDATVSGEEWAREMLEAAPAKTRRELRRGWPLLGLKLESRGAEGSILGWRVRHSDAEFALLGAESRIGMPAELLFRPEPGGLLFATFVQQKNPLARIVWAAIGPHHRRVVPALLRRAAERVGRGPRS
jgi:hypothetical protein